MAAGVSQRQMSYQLKQEALNGTGIDWSTSRYAPDHIVFPTFCQGGGAVEPVLCAAEAEGPWHPGPLLAACGDSGLCVRHPTSAVPDTAPDPQLGDHLP